MLVNAVNMSLVFSGFKAVFNQGFDNAESHLDKVAMTVPSSSREETYGWMGEMPNIREWVGARVIRNLTVHSYTIANKDFESTVGVSRNDIEDDRFGVIKPVLAEMGRNARQHPDSLVFDLLKEGFNQTCYDGQNFFDTDHPVVVDENETISVSNMQAGAGPAWFLLDTTRAMKPMVWQKRRDYVFINKDRPEDDNVFMNKEFIYGCDGRGNAGYGLWQLAFASKADLTPANYEAARLAMSTLRGDNGRKLNIRPNLLVVPPALEGAAKRLLNNGSRIENADNGSGTITPVAVTNEWAGTADLVATDFVS